MSIDNTQAFDRNALIDQLDAMGCRPKGTSCHCPWHEDRTPSAGIFADDTGHWRVKCHTCNRVDDVYGLKEEKPSPYMQTGKIMARTAQERPAPEILATKEAVHARCKSIGSDITYYKYGPIETPVMLVARIVQPDGKKTFRQFSIVPEGYATCKLPGLVPPLYMHHQIKFCDTVLVVEGEKCADAAWKLGIPATTSMGGANGAANSDWSALAGKKVVLWPDFDANGETYMDEVQEILKALDCQISRINPEGIGMRPKGDIADLAAEWKDPGEREKQIIEALMDDAEGQGAMKDLEEWHANIASGKWVSLPWPLKSLGNLSRSALPGSLLLICADPGAGKSWLMLQLLDFWHDMGVKACVRMFEDSAYVHMARLLAQLTGEGGHTDDGWIKENQDLVAKDIQVNRQKLNTLGNRIVPETDDLWGPKEVIRWAENSAKAGARVIMFDPVTAVKTTDKPWLQDFELAMQLKSIAKKYGCTIIITTHPRGSAKEPSLTGMAGGVAWPRFAHSVMWLQMHKVPEAVNVWPGHRALVNRTMHILKCRHGKGDGASIGLNFGKNVRFTEAGIIAPEGMEAPDEHSIDRKVRASSSPADSENTF